MKRGELDISFCGEETETDEVEDTNGVPVYLHFLSQRIFVVKLLTREDDNTSQCNSAQAKPMEEEEKDDNNKDDKVDNDDEVDNDRNNDDKLEKDTKVNKDDEVDKDDRVDIDKDYTGDCPAIIS